MTKYLVFKNQIDSDLANELGSREEMACDIAMVVAEKRSKKNSYIAYRIDSPKLTVENSIETAKFAVVIDDKLAELWRKEFEPMSRLSHAIDDAIRVAYRNIYECARSFDRACENTEHCKEFGVLDYMGIDRAFESFEQQSNSHIATLVEELYEVDTFMTQRN